jgi:thioredoxin-like negative regulator of GroEL
MDRVEYNDIIQKSKDIIVVFALNDKLKLRVLNMLKERRFLLLDYDENKNLAISLNIRKLPTVFVYKNGELVKILNLPFTEKDLDV